MPPTRPLVVCMAAFLLMACGGGGTPTTPPASAPAEAGSATAPLWRYVNSGWVLPYGEGQAQAFNEELRAFIMTSQDELDAFQQTFAMKRSLGTATSLSRVDFPNSILLAAYYLWRPLQGDPLSVVGFSLDGRRADVLLELEESPQGKEYPFLFAPMAMVALDRSLFPAGEPIDFVFHLNGEPQATVAATVD